MLDHPIIDVGLGLIFFYVVLSLVASAVQEWIASLCALRSKNLRKGVQNLLGGTYAEKVYEHPLIKNLSKDKKLPSYINPDTLSGVVLEVIAKESNGKSYVAHSAEEAKALVSSISSDHPLKEVLAALIDDGDDAATALKDRLAGWFDEGMSRVAGWYKRQAKVMIFAIAGSVTLATNASSIHMAEEFWRNDALRTQIAAQAQVAAQTGEVSGLEASSLDDLEAFPIGWSAAPSSALDWLKTLLGWIITTAAVSLGAPFWFDLLGKVANLRGSGGQTPVRKTP
ncbi:MAG: hypothetical protein OXH60_10545 [Rhodospirillales bacterium]|nr:hypothetical protein [Rhodospirillales bacterium]